LDTSATGAYVKHTLTLAQNRRRGKKDDDERRIESIGIEIES